MTEKQCSGPPFTYEQRNNLIQDLDSLDRSTAADDIATLAAAEMKADVLAIQRGEIPYGDSSLAEVVKRVLKAGAQEILNGTPSPCFLRFIADSINNTIDDEEPNLDVAFGLRRKRGNQQKPPQDYDHIASAFKDAMQCAIPWLKAPGRGEAGFERRERRALDAAYCAMYGMYQHEHAALKFNAKSITDRMNETKRLLQRRGLWMQDRRKGRSKKKGK